ncbi:MAG: hypothetical protein ACI9YB_002198, partial [Halioglobus sp.]
TVVAPLQYFKSRQLKHSFIFLDLAFAILAIRHILTA